jgi:hypothetical protein
MPKGWFTSGGRLCRGRGENALAIFSFIATLFRDLASQAKLGSSVIEVFCDFVLDQLS